MSALDSAIVTLLTPADKLRAGLLRRSGPVGRKLIADRQLRINTLALAGISTSLAFTAGAPLWLLVVGPLVLGVPHLLADVRYLVVRPGLHRSGAWWLLCAAPLALMFAVSAPWVGALAVLGGAAWSRARPWLWLAALALLGLALARPDATTWVMLHLHNLVAVALWWTWREGSRRRLIPVLAFAAVYAAILFGALDGLLIGAHTITRVPADVPRGALFSGIAGGLPAPWDVRVVASFAFAQSVHYMIWLRWIPEDDRRRYTPRPLLATYRALRDDFHLVGLMVFAGLAAAIWALSLVDLSEARDGYYRLAAFHAWLELACIVRLVTLRQRVKP